jgi:hypothetical protein
MVFVIHKTMLQCKKHSDHVWHITGWRNMADKKNGLPKVPPFVKGSTRKAAQEPVTQNPPEGRAPKSAPEDTKISNQHPPEQDVLSWVLLLVSFLSFGIAMAGATWVATDIFDKGLENQIGILPKVFAIGLAYVIGWIVSIISVRVLGHSNHPLLIKVLAWITLAGLCILQIAIIYKLYAQAYSNSRFILYLLMMGIGLLALIGFHLIVEDHDLVPFSFPILVVSLIHLIVIVSHYVFAELEEDKYAYFWSDAFFFLFTTAIGVLMLSHLGLLNGARKFIALTFTPQE